LQTSKDIALIDRGTVLEIRCPRCGGEYLRHTGAVFFERGEDEETLVKVEVDGANTSTSVVPSAGSGNPSSRRHGMYVRFSCEQCTRPGDTLQLNIAQHKGATEVSWTFSPRVK
jgi:hypothetical protein